MKINFFCIVFLFFFYNCFSKNEASAQGNSSRILFKQNLKKVYANRRFASDMQHAKIIPANQSKRQTKYLFVVTLDGVRWQELFYGADSALLKNRKFTRNKSEVYQRFWMDTPDRRRKNLMPFLWSIVRENGQIHGNRSLGSRMNVANNKWISYPGYNEMFTGAPDDRRIISNLKISNPNINVFEFLNQIPAYENKIAAFTTWDAFPYILHRSRNQLTVCSGKDNDHAAVFPDDNTWEAAMDHIRTERPSVCFISLDDTDREAHEGHYDRYLLAIHRNDQRISELWDYIQNSSHYRDQTTLIITTDHGRGKGKQWRHHSFLIPHSDQIWLAAVGADIPVLGEVGVEKQLWQEQIAQTIAHLLGYNFISDHVVAAPIQSLLASENPQPQILAADKTPGKANTRLSALKK